MKKYLQNKKFLFKNLKKAIIQDVGHKTEI